MGPEEQQSNRPIPALTGMRAIAAYAVFVHHYNPAPADTFVHRLLNQGYIGVSVFFVLSGFLIHYRYANHALTNQGWSWQSYARNRFARVYPLYAVVLAGTAAGLWLLGRPMSGAAFGLNLFLLQGFFNDYKFSGIQQSWTLTVEACFYASAPFLFVALRRWGWLRLTTGLTGLGILTWVVVQGAGWPVHGFFGTLPFVLFYTFPGRAFEFIIGMVLAQCCSQGRLPQLRYPTALGLLVMGLCILWQSYSTGAFTDTNLLVWSEVILYNYSLPVGIALFFAGLLLEKTFISRLLGQPLLQALGKSSYAFYLIHIGVLSRLVQKTGLANSAWVLFLVLVVLAHGLYVLVEKPLQRYFRSHH
jgi:peptidoglycan/LPS O-acetylase OafA/YrhL